METNTCKYCGKPLPRDAAFCPWCEREQREAPDSPVPPRRRPRRRGIIAAFILAAALLVLFAGLRLRKNPTDFAPPKAALSISLEGRELTAFLSFSRVSAQEGTPMESVQDYLGAGMDSGLYSWLSVTDEVGTPGTAEDLSLFASKIRQVTVTAVPRDGAEAVETEEPEPLDFEADGAVWRTGFLYGPENGTNDLLWRIELEDGTVLSLGQTFTCKQQKILEYHYQDTPLSTYEEIEALLHNLSESEDENTVAMLYLPPVTYTGTLNIEERTASLFGSEENGVRTTFSGPMTVTTRVSGLMELYDIDFTAPPQPSEKDSHEAESEAGPTGETSSEAGSEGEASIGLKAHEAMWLDGCSFTGWDIGADAEEGSWLIMKNCTFLRNQVGFCFHSHRTSASDPAYEGLTFEDNGTAVQLLKVPGDTPLTFESCTFTGNGIDIEDPNGLARYYSQSSPSCEISAAGGSTGASHRNFL